MLTNEQRKKEWRDSISNKYFYTDAQGNILDLQKSLPSRYDIFQNNIIKREIVRRQREGEMRSDAGKSKVKKKTSNNPFGSRPRNYNNWSGGW